MYKHSILFVIGAISYFCIEMLYRGYSHWTMAVLGGICFIEIGLLNEFISWNLPLIKQMCIGSILVTFNELIAGLLLNLVLKLNIWDYSNLPLNLWGQICLPFMVVWFFITLLAILIDDYLRYWMFKEDKPHYKLF